MPSKNLTPIADLFETHLTVTDLDRAAAFYRDQLALPLAHIFPERKVAFFWIGAPGKAMLGLWEASAMPINVSLHVAEEPVVLAWMPAASVYFRDPDNKLPEFIAILTDPPRPDLGILPRSDWVRRTSPRV
jgi:lactoylglutathione lyase